MIRIDAYTRIVLAIIAASLVWLCLDRGFSTQVEAQVAPSKVVVVGWQDREGYIHPFPGAAEAGNRTVPAGLPVRNDR